MNRREFFSRSFVAFAGGTFAACLPGFVTSAAAADKKEDRDFVTVIDFDDSGRKVGPQRVQKVRKTDAEWKQQLTPEEFEIARKSGTERAFTGQYAESHDKGLYRCICCNNALFSWETKFDSGTGWPSFWAPIAKENVRTSNDMSLGMSRTEVSCTECNAHLGHVFDDGPRPTGLRYCMNSASLRFIKLG